MVVIKVINMQLEVFGAAKFEKKKHLGIQIVALTIIIALLFFFSVSEFH